MFTRKINTDAACKQNKLNLRILIYIYIRTYARIYAHMHTHITLLLLHVTFTHKILKTNDFGVNVNKRFLQNVFYEVAFGTVTRTNFVFENGMF